MCVNSLSFQGISETLHVTYAYVIHTSLINILKRFFISVKKKGYSVDIKSLPGTIDMWNILLPIKVY